ncbi:MAG TPA: AAA family ATPase [Candidatus Sulfotelmatobacter sp.]|nr:AAA family ATPase [Candidatus Sulfotelmatobacter sp.]
MRKWMRERLQRRKQKKTEKPNQPATPPLQPAYFDAAENPEPAGEQGGRVETPSESAASEAGIETAPAMASEGAQPKAPQSGEAALQSGRTRRRRGGRGSRRGGRGREKAVAEAFAPAGAKGKVSESPGETAEETQPEIEPEAAPSPAATQAAPVAPTIPAAPARPPKGIVVLAIGLPGSGKSTWFKRHNVTPLSSDMLRSLLFDDVREQRFQDLVFSNLRSMLKARLIARRPMNYVDATNLTPKEREHWIKLAKDYHYEVQAVFFDVPLEVCIERHQRRDRVVPEDAMRRMAAKLKPPTFDEGFVKITVVRVKKKSEPIAAE